MVKWYSYLTEVILYFPTPNSTNKKVYYFKTKDKKRHISSKKLSDSKAPG